MKLLCFSVFTSNCIGIVFFTAVFIFYDLICILCTGLNIVVLYDTCLCGTMVFITLPPNLTEEEEVLQQKFAKLKKKVR